MSLQVHARVDEKYFEIVHGSTSFKYRRRVQEAVFICLNRVHHRKVVYFSESFSVVEKLKSHDELFVDLPKPLYCACAPADLVP